MPAAVLAFVPNESLERAITVLDIALGRGLAFDRAMYFALESLGTDPGGAPRHVSRLIESRWRMRGRRFASHG